MELFKENPNAKQIERIKKGIIQKSLIISASTTSADKARILMIQELKK